MILGIANSTDLDTSEDFAFELKHRTFNLGAGMVSHAITQLRSLQKI